MKDLTIEALLNKYHSGDLKAVEQKQLEKYIESGEIPLEQLEDVKKLRSELLAIATPEPSVEMDNQFRRILENEKSKVSESQVSAWSNWWTNAWQYQWQWAYSIALMLLSGMGGYYWSNTSKVEFLSQEVKEMREMVMLSMLEKESTTERLKAVNLTSEMNTVSDKVAMALINTLRHDDNNNVRMAAIDALALYVDEPTVRQELISSIKFQDSPLVQLALSELMEAMNESKAEEEFKQLWRHSDTPKEVQNQINEKMSAII